MRVRGLLAIVIIFRKVVSLLGVVILVMLLEIAIDLYIIVTSNGRGKLTASSLSSDGFPLMAGPNFQPSDGNPTVI